MSFEVEEQNKNYEVGYGKPPRSGQFKKGKSGNPEGSSAARRRAKPEFGNPFQEKLGAEVEIQENGKPVRRTLKHLGVRKLVEAAAKGDMRSLRDMVIVQRAPDPSRSLDDYYHTDLLEGLVWGPPEVLLYEPDTIVVRDPPLGEIAPKPEAGKRSIRTRKRNNEPRDQTWKSLVLFELERSITVRDRATDKVRVITMRNAILEQLATAFAQGKKGAMKLTLRFNEMVEKRKKKLIPVVHIPHDYVIPPKCDDSRGWPPGHEHHKSWRPYFPGLKPSTDNSGA